MNKPNFKSNTSNNHPADGFGGEHAPGLPQEISSWNRPNDSHVLVPSGLDEELAIRKSIRTRRRNFTIACTAFTIGMVAILFSSNYKLDVIAPGPLSSHHAPLASSENGDRCAACHANAKTSLVDWIGSVFKSSENQGMSQSQLCMKCHENSISSQFALNPHNVEPASLAEKTRLVKGDGKFQVFHPPVNDHQQIACSVCHKEHHGGAQLTALTDSQCQSCHAQSFTSFEHGHPEFTNYPQKRRSRIAFDHSSHAALYFKEKGKEFDCSQCHLDDSYQNVKKLASFEQSCAVCHNDQILDSSADGLALISLPMLDMKAIEQARLSVGTWPLAATGDFDGSIPPLMRVLLMADEKAKQILTARGPKFEFLDLDAENTADIADAVELTWAIKRLIGDLANQGPSAIKDRLDGVLGVDISKAELSRMITTLDQSVFRLTAQTWLPRLNEELKNQAAGKVSDGNDSHTLDSMNQLADSLIESASEQQLAKNNGPFRKASFASAAVGVTQDEQLAVNPLVELMGGRSASSNGSSAPKDNPPPIASKDSAEPTESTGAPVADPTATSPKPAESPEQVAKANPSAGQNLNVPKPSIANNQSPVQHPLTAIELNEELFDTLNRPSGWYRNDKTFQISYRPAGHADPCLQSWIELASRIENVDQRPETSELFDKILRGNAIGRCQSCHTADKLENQQLFVNWKAEYRDPARKSFTRFSHGPHLTSAELRDCSYCHQLDTNRKNAASFVSFDLNEVISNFAPINKSQCVNCHEQGKMDSGCTQCHRYHVDQQPILQRYSSQSDH